MKPIYFAMLTARGEEKFAQAAANQNTLKLTKMAVGDGNNTLPTPDRMQTHLVHEQRRAPINTLFIDPANPHQLIAEQIIPEDAGGWWIREIGLFDEDGDLCAVANCPPTYKPKLAEGAGRTQIIRLILAVTSTDTVELKVDPSIVVATRQYVDQAKQEAADLIAQALKTVSAHFAPIESPALTGTPLAPTPEPNNHSEQLATTAFVQAVGQRYVTSEQGDSRYVRREEQIFPELQFGYQVLPSGLILQWGVAHLVPHGSEVRFPLSFPHAVFTVQLSHIGPLAAVCLCQTIQDQTKFTAAGVTYAGNHYPMDISWFALGH